MSHCWSDCVHDRTKCHTSSTRNDLVESPVVTEQVTDITMEALELEFTPASTNDDRGVAKLWVCVEADAHSTNVSHEL